MMWIYVAGQHRILSQAHIIPIRVVISIHVYSFRRHRHTQLLCHMGHSITHDCESGAPSSSIVHPSARWQSLFKQCQNKIQRRVENPPIRQIYQCISHPSLDLLIPVWKIPHPILNLVERKNNESMSRCPNLIPRPSPLHASPPGMLPQLMHQQRMSLIPDIAATHQTPEPDHHLWKWSIVQLLPRNALAQLHLRNVLVVKSQPRKPSPTRQCHHHRPSTMNFVHGRALKTMNSSATKVTPEQAPHARPLDND